MNDQAPNDQPGSQAMQGTMQSKPAPDTQAIFSPLDAGDLEAVRHLLEADPGLAHARRIARDEQGELQRGKMSETALIAAAKAGHLDIVKLLIEYGAEIYEPTQWGYPAIEHALWAKQEHVVEYFLGEAAQHESMRGAPTYGLGIDVNLAARNGWLALVEQHIQKDSLAVHRRGVIGETPLHWAAHNGQLEIVRRLLDAGASLEADEIGCYGGKPLHWAAEHAPAIVRLLLDRGAQVNSRNVMNGDLQGVTPLIMCALQRDDCAECAQLLLAAGADASARDARGKTALDHALERGHQRVAEVVQSHLASLGSET